MKKGTLLVVRKPYQGDTVIQNTLNYAIGSLFADEEDILTSHIDNEDDSDQIIEEYYRLQAPYNMTDHKNMRSIHSKDTSIELQLRKALWHKGYRYRKNYKALPGSPDIVLTKYKIAIFCDSEFFHGKDWEILKLRLEKGKNPDYWIKKIERNRSRDFETDKKLLFLGYTVIHFWGQDIKKHTDECIQAIEEAIWDSTFSDSSFDSSDE